MDKAWFVVSAGSFTAETLKTLRFAENLRAHEDGRRKIQNSFLDLMTKDSGAFNVFANLSVFSVFAVN
jgi:hypothetical protein